MLRCPKDRWRVASITALSARYRELVERVRYGGAQALCYERAAIRVQSDLFQVPEIATFDLIDELVAMERFLVAIRRHCGAERFDLWFALRVLDWKPAHAVEAGFSPWALSTLYERIHDRWLEEIDAEVCTELVHAGWWDFDAQLRKEPYV